MGFFSRFSEGLARTRERFKEEMNVLLDRGPDVDEDFWEGLEDTLIMSDMGAKASYAIVESLREEATRKALPDAYAVLDALNDRIAEQFAEGGEQILDPEESSILLFVGVNGSGKTTTVGKLACEAKTAGVDVVVGGADTFRAAAIEQLQVWAERADVTFVSRERGSDPASVCYETIEVAEREGAKLVLIDTAGRLHTSADLMRELGKVVNVVRKRAGETPVYTVLVIDATTGQNGLQQAREFNSALELDAVVITKLDGTAKGGIAVAVANELGLPIIKLGVGEGPEDLKDFDAHEYAAGLVGDYGRSADYESDEDEGDDESEESYSDDDEIGDDDEDDDTDEYDEDESESGLLDDAFEEQDQLDDDDSSLDEDDEVAAEDEADFEDAKSSDDDVDDFGEEESENAADEEESTEDDDDSDEESEASDVVEEEQPVEKKGWRRFFGL